jgi:RNA polymerase sigma factor (sigma-70 family)
MSHLVKGNESTHRTPAKQEASEYYHQLLFQNYQFIKRQCYKIWGKNKEIPSLRRGPEDFLDFENQTVHVESISTIDPEGFFNDVLAHLTADDYKALREFKNRSTITTYLTIVISRLFIDIQRKHTGRSRTKDRARALGPIGEELYELIWEKGFPLDEAYEYLKQNDHITETLEEIEAMVDKITGRPRAHKGLAEGSEQPDIKSAFVSAEDPEKELIKKERKKLANEVLNEIRLESSTEERFIIERKFPLSEDEEPKDLSEIARILGITTKAVDSRLRRILAKLKEKMLSRGLSFDDFIDAYT